MSKKYIRTKDGIEKVPNDYANKLVKCPNLVIGDTIKELCDEFIFEDSDGHYLCNLCELTDVPISSKFDELKYWFYHSKEEQYKIRNCYGAIWTDKGLIYVAKLNDKGEFELL